ncbi:MAG: RNA methyltransferase [Myxococcales bacterium]|nr:RNA methyltransferase [Myxococcales bacterium]MCB9717605.1 RNA methyltransferase [Myxococcales bacterium]
MSEPPPRYRARACTASGCGLRFPVAEGSPLGERCPVCGAPTEWVDDGYRTHGAPPAARAGRLRLELLLDNVRSLRNVGSMFRTADGVGIDHLHLGGVTPGPEHPKLAKTALGAERSVPWSRHPDACRAAAELRARGRELWALEGGPRSVSLYQPEVDAAARAWRRGDQAVVLVLGHEVSGVDPRIVDQCERVVHLPMMGHKDSLNVSVTLGVAAYHLRFGIAPDPHEGP